MSGAEMSSPETAAPKRTRPLTSRLRENHLYSQVKKHKVHAPALYKESPRENSGADSRHDYSGMVFCYFKKFY